VAQSDGYYMAEALGMTTVSRPGTTPAPVAWPVSDLAQIDSLSVPDPLRDGRMPVYLGALRQLRGAAGDELAVRACGTGAFSLAGHLMGPEGFVTALAMLDVDPDPVAERRLTLLMEVCTQTTITFSLAALEHGADVVMIGDSLASLDMISPAIYERWALPYERAFFERVRPAAEARGALALLHVCGDTTPILALEAATGTHVIEFDWKVDPAIARRTVDAELARPVALMGNLDPTSVLLQGTPELVRREADRAIAAGVRAGATAGRDDRASRPAFLLGSGCEVAPATPLANARAMVSAAAGHRPLAAGEWEDDDG